MNKDNDYKLNKLYAGYLEFISTGDESRTFLVEKGLDPDALANEAIKKAKLAQMRAASRKTQKQYQELRANFLQKAKSHVEKILNDASFNLEFFLKQENIRIAFKNFEKMDSSEVKEFLERHYLLKFEEEQKEKD